MNELKIPVPFLFNPLKHHLGELIATLNTTSFPVIFTVLKSLGASQMDMYTGSLTLAQIFTEIDNFLKETRILCKKTTVITWLRTMITLL